MSFRSRLLLFFTIIVIVPMLAVALVLFSLTADSETGKADAAIAEGLRGAFVVYDLERAAARDPLARVAADADLAAALRRGDAAAAGARVRLLRVGMPAVRRIAVYVDGGRLLAAAGDPTAVAPAVAAPTANAHRIGLVALSTTSADTLARRLRTVTALGARIAVGGRVVASTLSVADRGAPASGDVGVAGHDYRGRFTAARDPVGPPVAIGLFQDRARLGARISDRRVLIAAILGGFLLLALLSSVVVVRALQRQVGQFLDAARRLARGDFSRPVPIEGRDEFAALGHEFNAMSEQLATTIHEVQRKRGELEDSIRRVGDAFAAGLDRQEMVNLAVRTAVEACEADAGRALPIDRRRMKSARAGEHDPDLERALEAAERRAFEIRPGGDAHDWLAELDAGPERADAPDQRRPVRVERDGVHALAVPLLARLGRGRSVEQVGVVSIARRRRAFDESEVELFAYLTGQAAVSIENVDLHEMVRFQAVTDELTGLNNLRYFHEALDAEIERSRRFATDVGLLLLDIDDFKLINDSFGHQQGDLVLIKVARVLRNLSRDIDVPARYGGEEMAVILPQTDVAGAELLAERMRAAIAALSVERLEGDGRLGVTASFGVASLPANARDKETLIQVADAALYRAKRAGKNRVRRGDPVTAES